MHKKKRNKVNFIQKPDRPSGFLLVSTNKVKRHPLARPFSARFDNANVVLKGAIKIDPRNQKKEVQKMRPKKQIPMKTLLEIKDDYTHEDKSFLRYIFEEIEKLRGNENEKTQKAS